jgi:heterodisulfide reductase subunit C
MKITIESLSKTKNPFLEQVERETGEDLSRCYQCGNCSGSCPVSDEMEIPVMEDVGYPFYLEKAMGLWPKNLACAVRLPNHLH